MRLLMLLVASVAVTPPKPVVTTADRVAMRAACSRWSRSLADPAVRPVQLQRCLTQIPSVGAPLVTRPSP